MVGWIKMEQNEWFTYWRCSHCGFIDSRPAMEPETLDYCPKCKERMEFLQIPEEGINDEQNG